MGSSCSIGCAIVGKRGWRRSPTSSGPRGTISYLLTEREFSALNPISCAKFSPTRARFVGPFARLEPVSKPNWSKESRHKRGYGTAWDKLRLYVLRRDNGLCQCSLCMGGKLLITPATEVNHIVPKAAAQRKGWTEQQIDDPSNLQSVAHECHLRITAEQQGKEHKPKIQIGMDGYLVRATRGG